MKAGLPPLKWIIPLANRSAADIKQKRKEFESEALVHLDSLYKTAFHLTRDTNAAEDLVQDACLRAFRFWDQYEKGTNCRAWLLRILRNTYINQYRRQVKQPARVDYEELDRYYDQLVETATVAATKDPSEELFSNLIDDEIVEAMEQLPDEFRQVVILSDLESLSYKEIADVLECPVGTVRSRLNRGRKLLQSMLYEFALKHGFIREGNGTEGKASKSDE